jgi:hypothetical protein
MVACDSSVTIAQAYASEDAVDHGSYYCQLHVAVLHSSVRTAAPPAPIYPSPACLPNFKLPNLIYIDVTTLNQETEQR